MKKKKHLYIIYILLFICIFAWMFKKVTHILSYKVHQNDTVGSFYKEKHDSIDVLFVGSSHSFSSFSPMGIWSDTGIASYNLATGSQTIPCSYYLIKEGIRTQHPKVIVLETYGFQYDSDYMSEARLHEVVDNIPFNLTKLELTQNLLSEHFDFHEKLEFIFPIIRYHTRWYSLGSKDIKPRKVYLRGFCLHNKIQRQEKPELTTETGEIYQNNLEYFDKIIDLCEKNGIELVLCQAPMGESERYKSICQKTNTLKQYAEDREIRFVDFELLREEIELDYAMDFKNETHLNIIGAAKTTKYMGNYLRENFQLPDHRGESNYLSWDEDYEKYSKTISKTTKKMLKSYRKKQQGE